MNLSSSPHMQVRKPLPKFIPTTPHWFQYLCRPPYLSTMHIYAHYVHYSQLQYASFQQVPWTPLDIWESWLHLPIQGGRQYMESERIQKRYCKVSWRLLVTDEIRWICIANICKSTLQNLVSKCFKVITPTAPMTWFAAGATPGDELNFELGRGGHGCNSSSFSCVGLGTWNPHMIEI